MEENGTCVLLPQAGKCFFLVADSEVLSFHSSAAEKQCLTYQHGDLIFSN